MKIDMMIQLIKLFELVFFCGMTAIDSLHPILNPRLRESSQPNPELKLRMVPQILIMHEHDTVKWKDPRIWYVQADELEKEIGNLIQYLEEIEISRLEEIKHIRASNRNNRSASIDKQETKQTLKICNILRTIHQLNWKHIHNPLIELYTNLNLTTIYPLLNFIAMSDCAYVAAKRILHHELADNSQLYINYCSFQCNRRSSDLRNSPQQTFMRNIFFLRLAKAKLHLNRFKIQSTLLEHFEALKYLQKSYQEILLAMHELLIVFLHRIAKLLKYTRATILHREKVGIELEYANLKYCINLLNKICIAQALEYYPNSNSFIEYRKVINELTMPILIELPEFIETGGAESINFIPEKMMSMQFTEIIEVGFISFQDLQLKSIRNQSESVGELIVLFVSIMYGYSIQTGFLETNRHKHYKKQGNSLCKHWMRKSLEAAQEYLQGSALDLQIRAVYSNKNTLSTAANPQYAKKVHEMGQNPRKQAATDSQHQQKVQNAESTTKKQEDGDPSSQREGQGGKVPEEQASADMSSLKLGKDSLNRLTYEELQDNQLHNQIRRICEQQEKEQQKIEKLNWNASMPKTLPHEPSRHENIRHDIKILKRSLQPGNSKQKSKGRGNRHHSQQIRKHDELPSLYHKKSRSLKKQTNSSKYRMNNRQLIDEIYLGKKPETVPITRSYAGRQSMQNTAVFDGDRAKLVTGHLHQTLNPQTEYSNLENSRHKEDAEARGQLLQAEDTAVKNSRTGALNHSARHFEMLIKYGKNKA